MLKKAGITVAVATAAMLAMTPMAFAGHKHQQDNNQQSAQGQPAGANGQTAGSGQAAQLCGENVVIPPPSGNVEGNGTTDQGTAGTCTSSGSEKGQSEKHHKSNND